MVIEFEKRMKSKKLGSVEYRMLDVLLKVNDQYFDSNLETEKGKNTQKGIQQIYWNNFRKYYLDDYVMVVRLSGLHFNINEIREYIYSDDGRTSMILHYHAWPIDKNGTYDIDSFVLLVCNKRLFKKLFEKFWFALGCEIHFEGILVEPSKIYYLPKWSGRQESSRKYSDLLLMSAVTFDNLHNGFHFRVTARDQYFDMLTKGMLKK